MRMQQAKPFLLALALTWPTSLWAEVSLHTTLPHYQVAVLSALPAAPEEREQACRSAPASSPAGQSLAAAGWQVISELAFEDHTLVTFAAHSSPGMAGMCDYENGALAVFAQDRLLGLYWNGGEPPEVWGHLQMDRAGVVDLYTSTFPAVPVAELVRSQGGFVVQPRPAVLPACEGAVEVPQLWLEPIGAMREGLIALGWVPQRPVAADPIAADMQAQGFPEAESCSGTGQNYCSYDYAKEDITLRLVSLGELGPDYQPFVADYDVTCAKGAE